MSIHIDCQILACCAVYEFCTLLGLFLCNSYLKPIENKLSPSLVRLNLSHSMLQLNKTEGWSDVQKFIISLRTSNCNKHFLSHHQSSTPSVNRLCRMFMCTWWRFYKMLLSKDGSNRQVLCSQAWSIILNISSFFLTVNRECDTNTWPFDVSKPRCTHGVYKSIVSHIYVEATKSGSSLSLIHI